MKPTLFTILWTAFVLAFASFAHADTKDGVKNLQAIHAEFVKLSKNKESDSSSERNKLQREATEVVQRIADSKTKKLSADQSKAFASVIAESIPHDPASGIVGNNIDVIKANRKTLDKEFKRIPKKTRTLIKDAIKVFEDEEARGANDSEPDAA